MKKLIDVLKSYQGIAASLGIILPGYTFFTSHAPPLFTGITLITSALSTALLIIILNSKSKIYSTRFSFSILIFSFILLIAYLISIELTTVKIDEDTRWQAGFANAAWSLTTEGNNLILSKTCSGNTNEQILMCSGFAKENIFLIWQKWSVYIAGIFLMFLFTASSLLWTYGWGQLARKQISN